MERRHSTASESSNDSRQSSNEGLEGGRITKTMSPKVAVNPLQFVKVGPCDLYRSAQEQLKKVEEIKKAKKEHKDEAEDWQSNLDNWKCSRRKRQEHIIERVVEVKKLEQEEHERNRRRSKTFSEMMQERNTRGRKTSLPVWNDDSDDLSDLGLNNKNDSSSEGERSKECNGSSEQDSSLSSDINGENEKCHTDSDNNLECQEKPKPCTESEEYTYERAIQSYVNFTESRVKSRSSKSIDEDSKETKKESPPIPAKPKRGSITKIDTYISQIELSKNKTNGECTETVKKPVAVPKVDVHKRRELFEKIKETEDTNKSINKTSDVLTTKSLKERLSSLEKHQENVDNSRTNINGSVSNRSGLKERLTNIEKISSNSSFVSRRSSEPLSSQSIKERLSSFEKSKVSPPKVTSNVVEPTVSIKERLNSLHSSCEKEHARTVIPSVDPTFNEKLSNFKGVSGNSNYQNRAYSPDEIYSKREQHFRHRSLDSLDINQENMSNGSFERVQSLEDLDYRNYPASTFSGDTDREDSGIHTADVSSSVSQADDYDLHLDGNILDDIKMNHQPPIEEETKLAKNELNNEESLKNVSEEDTSVAKSLTPDSSLSEALPPILENPLEPLTASTPLVEDPFVNSYPSPVSSWSSHCNTFQVPEDGIGEPASHSVETRDNNLNNQITPNNENYQGDVELKPNDVTIEKDLANKVCLKTGSNDPMPSNEFVLLHASLSDKPEEKCDTAMQDRRNEFENAMFKNSETSLKYEKNENLSLTNSTQKNSSGLEVPLYKMDQPVSTLMPYEKLQIDMNIPIVNQLTEVIVESDPSCLFPLSPNVLEPPKEKPPPPPIENSDDENDKAPSKTKSLRRLDSTKRIKKELRQKRSSFLGLEGNDDDSYLEPELDLIRPPDMTTLLAEERRIERQLYRQSVCSESDSNQESRDSGVELDHKHHEIWSHSRNDSETFGNQSTTSEEDEIMKKEREIIETLEQEEKIRKQDLGEKLAMRLRELEAEKERIEWEHVHAESVRNNQNHMFPKHNHISVEDLDKCRSRDELDHEWCTPRSSLQDISHLEPPLLDYRGEYRKSLGDLTVHRHQPNVRYAAHRRSMPNLQEMTSRRPPPPPPPVLPMKHMQVAHPQPVPQHLVATPQQRVVNPPVTNHQQVPCSNGSSQMSRQALQALSAAPRSRLISGDSWQVRKKQQRPDSYNYQHWLIQEAEHRRITEQHERSALRRPEGSRPGGWPTSTPANQQQWGQQSRGKHLPDAIIQTLTQRVQSRLIDPNNNRRRQEAPSEVPYQIPPTDSAKEKMLSVSGKKRCSHCGDELGRGAAMIIESLQLFYHIDCFKCCVCCIQLGDGLNGTDVRVRNNKLHCHNCYSSDDGAKFSCV